MAIYVTGDCHGDWWKLNKDIIEKRFGYVTEKDFVIVCGDFGIWHDEDNYESWKLDNLSKQPFTILFVDGNHENFDRLYSEEFEIVDFHGGKAHKIRDNIYHLMRGYVFNICGKKIFAFGGASSHDVEDGILNPSDYDTSHEFIEEVCKWNNEGKMFRIKGMSWWEMELPTQDEMEFGMETLEKNDYKVDFVISHCLPQTVASLFSKGLYKSDCLTMYFNKLLDNGLKFDGWHCGHYHADVDYMSRFHIHYNGFERIA